MPPLPFLRTVTQVPQKGFVKTTAMVLALALKGANEKLKYLPKKTIACVNNSKMYLYPRQGGINYDLYLYRKREPLCTDFLIHSCILKEGDVVLDIGANIGYYVLIESQLVGKTGKVYAVEPVTTTFELMQRNLQLNGLTNVAASNFAFGEKDGESEIYVCNESNLCAMNKNAVGGKIVRVQKVPLVTVDTFFRGKAPPKLIRMDVEGYEYQIFKGMAETLKGNARILMELHYGPPFISLEKMDEFFRLLEENHFRVRFAVFEDKVEDISVVRSLLKKAGYKLPIILTNVSVQELKSVLQKNPMSPNVLFEKVLAA
ncbi:MAG: FkbM family methyltransferase [Candidatus Bathyarchaeia archaeon]|jgi:FkbM family methyltransferase